MNESKNTILYVDMDGVLVDFMGGAHKALGKAFDLLVAAEIADHKGFWENLKWLSDGKELWEYVKKYNPHILSAYADWDTSSKEGKREWIRKHLGSIPESRIHIVRRSEKAHFAKSSRTGKSNVLVDDFDKNISEYRKAGGIGVHHISTRSTIEKLKYLGYQ